MASEPPAIGVFRHRRDIDNLKTAFDRMDDARHVSYDPLSISQLIDRDRTIQLVKEFTPGFATSFLAKYPNETDVRRDGIGKNNQGADHILEQLQRQKYAALACLISVEGAPFRPFVKTLVSCYLNREVNKQRQAMAAPLCDNCKNCSCRGS